MTVSFMAALKFWTKLGFISFGGPAGQIAIMHQEVVERRNWIGENQFLRALNFCMLLPGPEAQQLATYIGWRLHGTLGGIAAGSLFVIPSIFVMLLLSYLAVAHIDIPVVAAAFYGIQPAPSGRPHRRHSGRGGSGAQSGRMVRPECHAAQGRNRSFRPDICCCLTGAAPRIPPADPLPGASWRHDRRDLEDSGLAGAVFGRWSSGLD
jgi:chromate transporter